MVFTACEVSVRLTARCFDDRGETLTVRSRALPVSLASVRRAGADFAARLGLRNQRSRRSS